MGLPVSLEVGQVLASAEACRVPGYRAEVRTASTSLAMLAAMRRASSRARRCAAVQSGVIMACSAKPRLRVPRPIREGGNEIVKDLQKGGISSYP